MSIVATVTRGHERGKAMPKNRRQGRLVIIACLLALIGLGAVVAWFFFSHINLQIAAGPVGSDGQKFLAAFLPPLAEEHPRVRLKVVSMADIQAMMLAVAGGAV